MNYRHIAVLFMLGLHVISMCAAQKSLYDIEHGRQAMINNTVMNLTYLTQGFDFLRIQNLVDTSFDDFLEQNVSHDEDAHEDMNFDQIIIDAENIITNNMKNNFLNTLNTALEENKNLDQFHDPVFLYVMQHKHTTMRDMVCVWLHEWSQTKDNYGVTPLHRAALKNNPGIVSMLIAAGADLNIQDNYYGDTPLYWAAINNCIEIARMLIAAGADLNIQNNNRNAPLHWVAFWNHIEILRMLIDAGAQLNMQDEDGKAPLHWAAMKNDIEIAGMLIAAGADLNTPDNDGKKAELAARTPKIKEIFAQARQKQQEKADAQAMARFVKMIRKDWR